MTFNCELVIEDKHGILPKLKLDDREALFEEPITMQEAEEWEKRLNRRNIPYVLAQGHWRKVGNSLKNVQRGYYIFVSKRDIFNFFSLSELENAKVDRQTGR